MIEYLREEVRVLKELLDEKRPPFNGDQRIRLAAKAKQVKSNRFKRIANIAPAPLLRWHRQ